MRFVVTFSHKQYEGILEQLLTAPPGYTIPTGLYRQLAVVVEAPDRDAAVATAKEELGWPDSEINLVPMGASSQDEIVAMLASRHQIVSKVVDPALLASAP